MGQKLTDRTALTSIATGDLLHVVDVSDTTDSAEGTSKKITQDNLIPDASDTVKGKVELATSAETITGTDTVRAVTPAGAAAAYQPLDSDLTAFASHPTYITTLNINPLFAPQGFLINGKISVTDAAGITVAVKTLAGSDPSASDPVYVRIGDTVRTISSALSVAKADGTNWCNAGSAELATKEIDYFVYLGYNATDGVVIGFSRYPGANSYDDFSATSTNEKYCAISTITNAAATDYYEVVGRFAATLSAGAGYTWSVPTYTAKNLIQRPIYETRWITATSSNPTNCTVLTRYKILGNHIFVEMKGTMIGTPNWTTMPAIPFRSSASVLSVEGDYSACGVGGYLDSGTANVIDGLTPIIAASSSTVRVDSNSANSIVSASSPITWATNDIWYIRFNYDI